MCVSVGGDDDKTFIILFNLEIGHQMNTKIIFKNVKLYRSCYHAEFKRSCLNSMQQNANIKVLTMLEIHP